MKKSPSQGPEKLEKLGRESHKPRQPEKMKSRPTLCANYTQRMGHPQLLSMKKSKKPARRKSRVTFPAISEEMKEWSAMLAGELNSWPHISTRKMFGFLFFYRKRVVFAAGRVAAASGSGRADGHEYACAWAGLVFVQATVGGRCARCAPVVESRVRGSGPLTIGQMGGCLRLTGQKAAVD